MNPTFTKILGSTIGTGSGIRTNWAKGSCGIRRTNRTHYQLVWSQSLVLLRLRFIWYMEPHPSASLGSAAWKAAVLDGLLMRHIGVDDGVRSHNLCVGNAMLYQLSYIHIWWNWWDLNPRPLRCKRSALPAELQPHMVAEENFEISTSTL